MSPCHPDSPSITTFHWHYHLIDASTHVDRYVFLNLNYSTNAYLQLLDYMYGRAAYNGWARDASASRAHGMFFLCFFSLTDIYLQLDYRTESTSQTTDGHHHHHHHHHPSCLQTRGGDTQDGGNSCHVTSCRPPVASPHHYCHVTTHQL